MVPRFHASIKDHGILSALAATGQRHPMSAPLAGVMSAIDNRVGSVNAPCGFGFWLGQNDSTSILEGYDAGASFRSTHIPETRTTVNVLGNSSEGAWPVIAAVEGVIDRTIPR